MPLLRRRSVTKGDVAWVLAIAVPNAVRIFGPPRYRYAATLVMWALHGARLGDWLARRTMA